MKKQKNITLNTVWKLVTIHQNRLDIRCK